MKLNPTIPNPTTTTLFLGLPCGSFSEPFTPSGTPSIGPPLITRTGTCGCQLLDIVVIGRETCGYSLSCGKRVLACKQAIASKKLDEEKEKKRGRTKIQRMPFNNPINTFYFYQLVVPSYTRSHLPSNPRKRLTYLIHSPFTQ